MIYRNMIVVCFVEFVKSGGIRRGGEALGCREVWLHRQFDDGEARTALFVAVRLMRVHSLRHTHRIAKPEMRTDPVAE